MKTQPKYRCHVDGCKACILGMDDLPLATVLTVVGRGWVAMGNLLRCPNHNPSGEAQA